MRLIASSEQPSWLVTTLEVLATLASVSFWFLSTFNIVHVESELLWIVIFFSAVPFYWFFRSNKTVMKTLEICVYAYLAAAFTLCVYLVIYDPARWQAVGSGDPGRTIKSIAVMLLVVAVEAAAIAIAQTMLARFSGSRCSGGK